MNCFHFHLYVNGNLTISIPIRSVLAGSLANDTVILGGLTAQEYTFALADHVTHNFENKDEPMDGILGR